MTHNYKNILIVRTDRIGDVVLTTPSIRALRKAFPTARISVLVSPVVVDLLRKNAYVDKVVVDDRKGCHKGFVGFLKLVLFLRKQKFDLAIIFHTKRRTNLMCFWAGILKRLGYKNEKFGFLLNHPVFDERHKGEKHEAQYCLDLLKNLGVKSDGLQLDLPLSGESVEWADQFIGQMWTNHVQKIIVLHPGASDPAKCWPVKHFAELIDSLVKLYGAKIILVGGSEVREVSEKIITQSNSEIVNLTGKTTVAQLAVLLAKCDLFVSNDSGPVHIAAALGINVVSIFTRNQPGINPVSLCP